MAKLAIVATFEIAPGRMDEFLPLLMAHRDRCLKGEAGTLVSMCSGQGPRRIPSYSTRSTWMMPPSRYIGMAPMSRVCVRKPPEWWGSSPVFDARFWTSGVD